MVTSSALTDVSPLRVQPRPSDTPQPGEPQDSVCSAAGTQFDFSPSNLEQPQEEDQDSFRYSQDDETLKKMCSPFIWHHFITVGQL